MPITRTDPNDQDLFEIDIPDNASAPERALKARFEPLRLALTAKRTLPQYKALLIRLQIAARLGFEGVNGRVPDRDSALVSFGHIQSDFDQLEAHPGRFVVEPMPRDGYRDIDFSVTERPTPVPADQLKFKADIEETLTTLQVIIPDKNWSPPAKYKSIQQLRFEEYRDKLASLAKVGLEGDVDVQAGQQALTALQTEILLREGPIVKNGYMKVLGTWAFMFGLSPTIVYLIVRNNQHFSDILTGYRNLFVLWTGTMIGAWLSFGIRRAVPSLRDLSNLEGDMVEPAVRLIFTGLIAVTIAFIFNSGMGNVVVGTLNSAQLFSHGSTAFLIGILLGISEQALPTTLTQRASQFVGKIAPN